MIVSTLAVTGAVLAQIDPVPKVALPPEWAAWIIGTLIVFIISLFVFLKWLIGLASDKTDNIVKEFKDMHTQGIERLDKMNETQIRIETKQSSFEADIKKELAETKYAVQTLNTKIKCSQE